MNTSIKFGITTLAVAAALGGFALSSKTVYAADFSGVKETPVSQSTSYNVFIGYSSLFPVWAQTTSYTLSQGITISGGFNTSYEGIGTSVSTSYTVSGSQNIWVKYPKQLSRLGLFADVTYHKVKDQYYSRGLAISSWYNVYETYADKVIKPRYQDYTHYYQ